MSRVNKSQFDETLQHENNAVRLFIKKHPNYEYVHTPKDGYSPVDAVLKKNDCVKAIVETKCRLNLSYDKFRHLFGCEWLLSLDKIIAGRQLAIHLNVPFVGFLYLVEDDLLLVQRICDESGLYTANMTIRSNETKRTMAGGKIVRNNAFIEMNNATLFRNDRF